MPPSRPAPLTLLIDALVVFRLTRLLIADKISEAPRERLARVGPNAAYFTTCPWCVSWWMGCLVVAARRLAPKAWSPVAEALAFSGMAGPMIERLG